MKIAIIKLSSLGDIVVSLVFLPLLKSRHPNIHITWIVDSAFDGLLLDSNYIDFVLSLPLRKSKKNKKLIFSIYKDIRSLGEFDLVLDLQGLLKSALIGKLLKTKNFIGYSRTSSREGISSFFYTKRVEIDYGRHVLERNFCIFKEAFNWSDNFDLALLQNRNLVFSSNSIPFIKNLESKNALFILEASKKEKEYPIESFYKVALGLKKIGIQKIYLIWDKKEKEIKELASRDNIFHVLPHLSLTQIKALLTKIQLVIGGDTGITHLAWALKRKSITLYGNTPIERFILGGENHISISKFKYQKIMKNDFSICDIESSEIVDAALKLLKKENTKENENT